MERSKSPKSRALKFRIVTEKNRTSSLSVEIFRRERSGLLFGELVSFKYIGWEVDELIRRSFLSRCSWACVLWPLRCASVCLLG